jgi:hypothetical protein
VTESAPTATARSGPVDSGQADRDKVDQASTGGFRLETAREWLLSGGSVLFFGPNGVGKSAALDLLAAAACDARVLRCAPGVHHVDRSYRVLAELLSSVTDAELNLLPLARRRVLVDALRHRAGRPAHGPVLGRTRRSGRSRWSTRATAAAVRHAALGLFRVLARSRPVLLVVDNIHLLDRASADVLTFVASRVGDLAIQMVAAEQVPADRAPVGRYQCPSPLLMTRPDPQPTAGSPAQPGRRRQGGKGAPWAVCRAVD